MLRKKVIARIKKQCGFTLIEMIVVVGIIAVLAAVILPNLSKYISHGEQGAKDVERDNVESAFQLMMAENQVFSVSPNDTSNTGTATNSWSILPQVGAGIIPLQGYLLGTSTIYFYCYDANGLVSELFETASACTLP